MSMMGKFLYNAVPAKHYPPERIVNAWFIQETGNLSRKSYHYFVNDLFEECIAITPYASIHDDARKVVDTPIWTEMIPRDKTAMVPIQAGIEYKMLEPFAYWQADLTDARRETLRVKFGKMALSQLDATMERKIRYLERNLGIVFLGDETNIRDLFQVLKIEEYL